MPQPTSVRLTSAVRDAIRADLLKHRFSKEIGKVLDEYGAVARMIYEDHYKAKDRKLIESLPKGWLPHAASVKVQISGSVREIAFNGACYGLSGLVHSAERRDPVCYPIPAADTHSIVGVYDGDHRIAKRHAAVAARVDELKALISRAGVQIDAALAAVSTTARLNEAWPEAYAFAKRFEITPVPLPAIPVRQLNEMLGLRPAKVAA